MFGIHNIDEISDKNIQVSNAISGKYQHW